MEYTVLNEEAKAKVSARDSDICDYFKLDDDEKEFFDQLNEYEKIRLANIVEIGKVEKENDIATGNEFRFRDFVGMKKVKEEISTGRICS